MQDFELLAKRIDNVKRILERTHSEWARSHWTLVEKRLTRKWKEMYKL